MFLYGCDLEWRAQTGSESGLQLARNVEVSLPCPGCRRDHRTIILSEHESALHWSGSQHPFEGRVVRKSLAQSQGQILARYRLEYEYEPFVDLKFSPDPVAYQPSWARVSFRIQCACGHQIEQDTQHNLTRPRSEVCDCGRLLLLEMDDALAFSPAAVVMFRLVRPEEVPYLNKSGLQAWPKGSPEQPFWTSFTHRETAHQAQGHGVLARFLVKPDFVKQFPVPTERNPWQIPVERLPELNANLVGAIEVEA